MNWRIFDLVVESELDLPELPRAGPGPAEFAVRMGMPQGLDTAAFDPRHEWLDARGRAYARVAKRDGDFLLQFEGYAAFLIEQGGVIHCQPADGCSVPLLRHFLVNQVIPRALASRGRLVVHAGAVIAPCGQALLFVGPTGRGKSTLVDHFSRAGSTLLADDCVLLDPGRTGVRAIGAHAGLRLAPDAVSEGEGAPGPSRGVPLPPITAYTGKHHLAPGPAGQLNEAPLGAVFLLGDPAEPSAEVRIEPVRGTAAFMSLLRSAFELDHTQAESTRDSFRRVGNLLQRDVPVARLDYPRRRSRLPEVHEAVKSWFGARSEAAHGEPDRSA